MKFLLISLAMIIVYPIGAWAFSKFLGWKDDIDKDNEESGYRHFGNEAFHEGFHIRVDANPLEKENKDNETL